MFCNWCSYIIKWVLFESKLHLTRAPYNKYFYDFSKNFGDIVDAHELQRMYLHCIRASCVVFVQTVGLRQIVNTCSRKSCNVNAVMKILRRANKDLPPNPSFPFPHEDTDTASESSDDHELIKTCFFSGYTHSTETWKTLRVQLKWQVQYISRCWHLKMYL